MKTKCDFSSILTVEEAAAMIDYTVQGIRVAIADGRLIAGRKGKMFLIHKTEMKRFRRKLMQKKVAA